MNPKTCTITIYTQSGALQFDVLMTADDFENRLAAAIEQGTVVLDLADGNKLVLSPINVVAVEIGRNDDGAPGGII